MISHHDALIYTMVMTAAADGDLKDEELRAMGNIVQSLPIFRDFDPSHITTIAEDCGQLLSRENGLDDALTMVRDALPDKLNETAYALAVDVAVSDGQLKQEELRILELVRHELEVDRLIAAAIERGAVVRHRKA
ncbi:MAG: tellurite resistance TerB family protein [Caenispirillum bisanense]|nr:tellurite resistance TerB family protein [Caenispirillum bisanense]MCA1973405.1 tellurite resistance TerB family protein [Caenispirillum sp.]